MSSKRVVLVVPRAGVEDGGALAGALDQIANVGWELVSVVDPAQHMDALHMVLNGIADVVVVTRPEHFPMVQQAADLGERSGTGRAKRTQRILRAETALGEQAAEPKRPAADHPWRKAYSEQRQQQVVERHEPPQASVPARTGRLERSSAPLEGPGEVRTRRSHPLRRVS